MSYDFLDHIEYPDDLRSLKESDLKHVCRDVREYIIDTLSQVGGHFASNLGVVELTVALHYVLNTPEDKLIWDVGHQIYPHKVLTGRKQRLRSVRRLGGLSGFPKREESPYDLYNTGHAGTSISQLIGEAVARDLTGKEHKCAAVIGDASIASGMAFEALNHGGHIKTDCLVVLNDNDMSISKNVGALNTYLNRMLTSSFYNRSRRFWYTLIMWLPVLGPALRLLSRKVEKSFKDLFMPGSLFEDFGFRYIGPVDGHDITELVKVLRKAVQMKGPILLHVLTQKGRGYEPAEANPIRYHSVSVFNRKDGSFTGSGQKAAVSYSEIVGDTLSEIFERNPNAVAVTPAMIEGSGLRKLYDRFPDRVHDVGIAEQHSVAYAGGLASGGIVPFMCIYSTFLNRAIDQLIEDVALMNLSVRFIIDRAGCVGPDGETHQGLYDTGMILSIPNMRLYAPATGAELKAFIQFMENYDEGPVAVRFPKGSCDPATLEEKPDVQSYKPVVRSNGKDLAIVAVGVMWETALKTEKLIRNEAGILSTIVGLRWLRPMDEQSLYDILSETDHFIMLEDAYIGSSASQQIVASMPPEIKARHLKTYAFPTESIDHGGRDEIMHMYGISAEAIAKDLQSMENFEGKVISASAGSSEM